MNPAPVPVFGQRYQTLPEVCFRRVAPTPLPDPYWVVQNHALAAELGLDLTQDSALDWLALFAGNTLLPKMQPLAARYSGHQFGFYVPQLGDGRALLLGDLPWGEGGRAEVQLKGAGLTPFSRMGDGRAVLRSSVREYLCSEAMAGLGIATTRALCLVGSPFAVLREQLETAAVLTRVAPSFVRFGSFEVLAHSGQTEALQQLADFVIQHHYPACLLADNPYAALFATVAERTAELIAAWQAVGFCHGVMNSDNMSILGLTLDYGPFGFLDGFDAAHICNHSDHAGRYAYNQQPRVAQWNLQCLGSALLPLVPEAELLQTLDQFPAVYEAAWLARMRAKLGLVQPEAEDAGLIEALLLALHAEHVDFTRFFRGLCALPQSADARLPVSLLGLFSEESACHSWLRAYRARLAAENSQDAPRHLAMRQVNPKYILRNYLAENAIAALRDQQDFSQIAQLSRCLAQPFDEQAEFEAYAALPPAWASELSLSCSS